MNLNEYTDKLKGVLFGQGNLLWQRLNNVWNVGIVTILSNVSIMRKRVQSVNIMSFL